MRTRRLGMTLMEVMVAMGILAGIAAMTWISLAGVLDARDTLELQDEVQQSARVAMDRITRELELAWLTEHTAAINTFRTVFVAEDNEPLDRIWFTSLSHRRMVRDSREGDQTEITLWTEDDPEHSGNAVLLHREAPRIDHEPDKDGVILPLAHRVERFDLSFLDGTRGEWVEEWDTTGIETPNRLPRAVRIVLVLESPDPSDPEETRETTYATTVLLQYSKALARSAFGRGKVEGG